MKKKITAFILSFVLVLLTIPVVPVYAIPSNGNVVQQMGGPVSSKFSLNVDDIIKNFASSKAYETRFYPFGEDEGMPVFIGTAHRVKDIHKTDAEIAYLDAMQKAGTDEHSLKAFLTDVKKYEATCQTSAQELESTLLDAVSTAVSAAGFSSVDAVSNIAGSVSIATGVGTIGGQINDGTANMDTAISGVFTLGDIAGAAGGLIGSTVLTAASSVLSVGSVAYSTFQKYMAHQEEWKDFANYLSARRNLTEFFKYLEAGLVKAMESSSGWDVQFNQCEYVDENVDYCGFPTPMTFTLTARFMQNYVSDMDFGQVTNPNEDGWAGNLELNMKAELGEFQNKWGDSPHCIISNEISLYQYAVGAIITENAFKIEDAFYWKASLSCLNFPLKTDNMDEKQSQIVFTGSLSSGTYLYWQSGKMYRSFAYHDEMHDPASGRRITTRSWSGYDSITVAKSGVSREYRISDWMYGDEVPSKDGATEVMDYGDMYGFEHRMSQTEAKMVIDISKPLGGGSGGKEKATSYSLMASMAEMVGVEPTRRDHRPAAFRVQSLRPLGYISIYVFILRSSCFPAKPSL